MRFLRSRPLTTPVKVFAIALLLGTGTMGATAVAAHAAGNDQPTQTFVISKVHAEFICFDEASCTAGSYGTNLPMISVVFPKERYRLDPTCKLSGDVGEKRFSYLGTVPGWTGTWRLWSDDFDVPLDDATDRSLPACK